VTSCFTSGHLAGADATLLDGQPDPTGLLRQLDAVEERRERIRNATSLRALLLRVRARQLLADAVEHLGVGLQIGVADLAVQLDNLLQLSDCPAELIPALQSGALGIPGSDSWPLTLFTPGARPVHELATQLASLTDDDDDTSSSSGDGSGRENQCRSVLVVDQFEETFTACQSEDERLAFITALCAAADGDTEPAALVIVGLRADFYPHALRYPALVSALQNHQVLVGSMTEAELRTAITGPAHKAGLEIEDGLVENTAA